MGICFFCTTNKRVLKNDLAFALFDEFPVSKGHMIFATKRHVKTFF